MHIYKLSLMYDEIRWIKADINIYKNVNKVVVKYVFKDLLIIYLAKAWKLLNKKNKDGTKLIAPTVFVFAVSTVLLWRPL